MRDSKMGGGGGFSFSSVTLLSVFSFVFGVVDKYSFLSATSAFSIRAEASWKIQANKVNIIYYINLRHWSE